MDAVCDGVCKKLITRHPNLFDGSRRPDWEDLKRAQRGNQTVAQAMAGVSHALPALWRADKLLSKAERSGCPQPDPETVGQTAIEEITALCRSGTDPQASLGRALFALVRLARARGLDPETALAEHCNQYIDSFSRWEAAAASEDK